VKKHFQYKFFPKQFLDITLSLFFIILTLPIMLIICLIIALTSKGPIIYKSPRMGKNFKPIFIYKFRTMHINAEKQLDKMIQNNPQFTKQWLKHAKLLNDPRITKIGQILRKYSLDELPQLFNVLKGELSLVGPRPYSPKEIETFVCEKARIILKAKPGLTGLWQTSGRSLIPLNQRIEMDIQYAHNLSFRKDMLYLCKTFKAVLNAKGAF